MKDIIWAKQAGRNDDKDIRFWYFTADTKNHWYAYDSKFAIVDTSFGYQLVEIIGVGHVNDEFEVYHRVIMFVPNSELPELNSNEQVDNQQ